jgi:hypothetical protein
VAQNGACVSESASTQFVCTSYEALVLNSVSDQLTTSTGANIPAQDPSGQGVCYYYPIVNSTQTIASSPSYLTGQNITEHDQDVVSADHDVQVMPEIVWHPYILNHTNLNMTFTGARTLQLTSGRVNSAGVFQTSDISIDNFFLVGVYPQSETLSTNNVLSYYSAWGTGDSVVANAQGVNTQGVAFNPAGIQLTTNETYTYSNGSTANYSNDGVVTNSSYSIVPLNVEASGGTAEVPAVSLTNLVYAQVPITLDFRAIDCGGSRVLGAVYLLIQ